MRSTTWLTTAVLLTTAWAVLAEPASVSLDGDAEGDLLAVSLTGDARGNVAVSGTGDATGCEPTWDTLSEHPACLAASGTGHATGRVAASIAGDAEACDMEGIAIATCVAVSGLGTARADGVAVSALGDAASQTLAVAPVGHASSGWASLSAAGRSEAAYLAVNLLGPSRGQFAASVLGDSEGPQPVSVLGTCNGVPCNDVRIDGPAQAQSVAVSGTGDSEAGVAAMSLTGDARGGVVAVAPMGNADGAAPVTLLGRCNGTACADLQVAQDAQGYWAAASLTKTARAQWLTVAPQDDAEGAVALSALGGSNGGYTVSVLGPASGQDGGLSASVAGDASNPLGWAASGTGDAWACNGSAEGIFWLGCGGASGLGDADGDTYALSGTGAASSRFVAFSVLGEANGGNLGASIGGSASCTNYISDDAPCIAVSLLGCSEGDVAVDLCRVG